MQIFLAGSAQTIFKDYIFLQAKHFCINVNIKHFVKFELSRHWTIEAAKVHHEKCSVFTFKFHQNDIYSNK